MPRILSLAVLSGLIAGILVGGYHNLFTVPVIEQAITLEEAAAAHPAGMPMVEEKPLVPLGVQRIGMVVGTAVLGVVVGLAFAGYFTLLRRALPRWSTTALALSAGALGFVALSLVPFIKYPVNPPGVGSEESLLLRQGFQFLLIALSGLGAAGVASMAGRRSRLAAALAAYFILVAAMINLIPGNPDPVNTPADLLGRFRTLSIVGHLLQWALLAAGVALALRWAKPAPGPSAAPQPGQPGPAAGPARR